MGAASSDDALSPRSQNRRQHKVSHSGANYVPPPDVLEQVPSHTEFDSDDFDKDEELKEKLPAEIKAYNNSIEILYRFWMTEIDSLDEQRYNEVTILFYVCAFKRLPEAKTLFNPDNIQSQAKKFFGMFRWLIVNLRQPDPERLIKRIRSLGPMHRKMNIKPEWFQLFLDAFHETMEETVKQQYTARTRFCMTQLYTVTMNIILDKDWDSLSSPKIAKLLSALHTLEDCLQDEEATAYLELYAKRQFCVELVMFYKDYRKYKESESDEQRQKIGEKLMKRYIGKGAECEVNLSNATKCSIQDSLKQNSGKFCEDMFDAAAKEVGYLLRRNVWHQFREEIMRMATAEDKQYEARMSAKNLHTSLPLTSIAYSHSAPSPMAANQVSTPSQDSDAK